MVSLPGHRAVNEGLGEKEHVAGSNSRLDDVVCRLLETSDRFGDLGGEVALVASGDTSKPAGSFRRVCQIVCHYRQPIPHKTVAILVPMISDVPAGASAILTAV